MKQRFKKGFIFIFIILFLLADGLWSNEEDDEKEYLDLFIRVYKKIKDEYVEEKSSEELIKGAIKGMLQVLNDPYTVFMEEKEKENLEIETTGEYGGLGIEISVIDNKLTVVSPIEDTPAERAGILPGDIIIKIEGKPVKDPDLEKLVKQLRGKPGTKVTITILREGMEPFDVTITREKIKLKSLKKAVIKTNIGYIKIVSFRRSSPDELKKALKYLLKEKKAKGLIIDLRNNPGGLLDSVVKMADYFLNKGIIVSTRPRKGVHTFLQREYKAHSWNTIDSKTPMVVLINKGSASASEIFAGAMKDNKRAIIVGEQSFGKSSVQTVIPLDSKFSLRYTTAYYYTPSGHRIHKTGIIPDIKIESFKPTREDYKNLIKLRHKKIIKNFLKENPDYTEKDFKVLLQRIKEEGITLPERIIKMELMKEKYRIKHKRLPVYNLEFDKQLRVAVDLLKTLIRQKEVEE